MMVKKLIPRNEIIKRRRRRKRRIRVGRARVYRSRMRMRMRIRIKIRIRRSGIRTLIVEDALEDMAGDADGGLVGELIVGVFDRADAHTAERGRRGDLGREALLGWNGDWLRAAFAALGDGDPSALDVGRAREAAAFAAGAAASVGTVFLGLVAAVLAAHTAGAAAAGWVGFKGN